MQEASGAPTTLSPLCLKTESFLRPCPAAGDEPNGFGLVKGFLAAEALEAHFPSESLC